MIVVPRLLEYYQTADGHYPFREWQESQDRRALMVIDSRLARIRRGLLGDLKSVGAGVF
jgi:putative component of toxin-antitoxin plasmid stabilization module